LSCRSRGLLSCRDRGPDSSQHRSVVATPEIRRGKTGCVPPPSCSVHHAPCILMHPHASCVMHHASCITMQHHASTCILNHHASSCIIFANPPSHCTPTIDPHHNHNPTPPHHTPPIHPPNPPTLTMFFGFNTGQHVCPPRRHVISALVRHVAAHASTQVHIRRSLPKKKWTRIRCTA